MISIHRNLLLAFVIEGSRILLHDKPPEEAYAELLRFVKRRDIDPGTILPKIIIDRPNGLGIALQIAYVGPRSVCDLKDATQDLSPLRSSMWCCKKANGMDSLPKSSEGRFLTS
jgi:hypothetical protein